MPIYLVEGDDHRQITTDDLAKMLKIDKKILAKLQKQPVFEINPKLCSPDRLNGGVIAPAGKASKPKVFIKVDKVGTPEYPFGVITDKPGSITKELRYAIAIVPDKLNSRISTYEPKRLQFLDQMDIVPNLEEALFKYILPSCKDSPIADKRNWYYSFQNKEVKAQEINDKGQNIAKALAYISNSTDKGGLAESQIMLIAKGLYAQNRTPAIIPNPSARNKTISEVKADLITLAIRDPELFLNSCDDDVNEFYGMIMDAVDRGIFGIRKGANSKSWYWEAGPQQNSFITDIANGVNDFDALRAAIEANPNAYYGNITRTVRAAIGKQNIGDFLKEQKAKAIDEGGSQEDNQSPAVGDVNFVLPTSYDEAIAMAILFNDGKRPSPKVLGLFWGEIKKGTITAENAKKTLEAIINEEI